MVLDDEEERELCQAHNYKLHCDWSFALLLASLLGGSRVAKRMHERSIITDDRVPKIPILMCYMGFFCSGMVAVPRVKLCPFPHCERIETP
jgi:hypothetical protein